MFNQFLINRFQCLSRSQFNGQMTIQSESGYWSLLFCFGYLVWVTGGVHPNRRWRRNIIRYCPAIAPDRTNFRIQSNDSFDCWQYYALTVLVKLQKISRQQAQAIVKNTIAEALFDLMRQASLEQLCFTINQQKLLEPPITRVDTETALKQANEDWEAWLNAGLTKITPYLAPVIRQPEQLQQQISDALYQNLLTLINTKNTLRDISIQANQDLLSLTLSLVPYIRQGIVGFIEVPDLPAIVSNLQRNDLGTKAVTNNNLEPTSLQLITNNPSVTKNLLIACVDDSPQTCQIMKQIFDNTNFRFISIQNSVQALPMLIESQPNLIFLDLMMPVVNGYELCSQLRRVSFFADTPMIILTGSDGIVDRVRARVVGASDFLVKPVESKKVLSVVKKYFLSNLVSGYTK